MRKLYSYVLVMLLAGSVGFCIATSWAQESGEEAEKEPPTCDNKAPNIIGTEGNSWDKFQ